jgi:hypothetical protein
MPDRQIDARHIATLQNGEHRPPSSGELATCRQLTGAL